MSVLFKKKINKLTQMESESKEISLIISRQFEKNEPILRDLAKKIEENKPSFVITIARGSSDHAASFLQYFFEKELGLVVASIPPSLFSIYKNKNKLQLKNALAIAISQSGESPDLCLSLSEIKASGALSIAMTNYANSSLSQYADFILPFHAGEEKSIAATKTYLASLALIIHLASLIKKDERLLNLMKILPEKLALIESNDLSEIFIFKKNYFKRPVKIFPFKILEKYLIKTKQLIIIARGIGYPIAQEIALKFKETCQIHAEPFSSAEFQHGPMALISKNIPILFLGQEDESLPSLLEICEKIHSTGATTFLILASRDPLNNFSSICTEYLSLGESFHPIIDLFIFVQRFYQFMARLSIKRGNNPDKPVHLKKITQTK